MSRRERSLGALTTPLGIAIAARVGLMLLCVVVAALSGSLDNHPGAIVGLVALAIFASLVRGPALLRWTPVVEAIITTVLVLSTDPLDTALLPYLLAPCLAAGLLSGLPVVIVAAGLSALTLLVTRLLGWQTGDVPEYFAQVSQWVVLAFAVGALAAWVRRIQEASSLEVDDDPSYLEAYRLLSDLRRVSRELSEGLDAVGIAQILLQSTSARTRYSWGAVQVPTDANERLVVLAQEGRAHTSGQPTARPDADSGPWLDAWRTGTTVAATTSLDGLDPGYSLVVPLRTADRTVAVLGIERPEAPFAADAIEIVERLARESALRLDAALLFSDVRTIATAEERRRVAREIHDGIAQELASIGYVVDDLAADAPDARTRESLSALRGELSRVIGELRMSIFDLRSEVATAGLGATLSDYARWVGATSDLTVHLTLDESPNRLRIETETELLRIAQEAITNARKHAGARNLWVRCSVAPPSAVLAVEDDGKGLGQARVDSYGLEIMQERAERLGADLSVGPRHGGGTVVEVVLGNFEALEGGRRLMNRPRGKLRVTDPVSPSEPATGAPMGT
jgi:signal transduction histidine kinase